MAVFAVIAIRKSRKDFDVWFEKVLKIAPQHGFRKEVIDEFDEAIWEEYYYHGYNPSEAIKEYLKDNVVK